MKKFKKIFLIFICFLLIFSIVQIPSSAIAVEIIGGSYVAYAVLAAALAACGITIAANQIDPSTFQNILDSSGAEDIKALIMATQVFASVNGRVFFNWTTQQWFTFVQWVNSFVVNGSVILPSQTSLIIPLSQFSYYGIDNYVEQFIPSGSNGIFGYYLGTMNATTVTYNSTYRRIQLNLSNGYLFGDNAQSLWRDSYHNSYMFGSPVLMGTSAISLSIGIGRTQSGEVAYTREAVHHCSTFIQEVLDKICIDNHFYKLSLNDYNQIIATGINGTVGSLIITGSTAFPNTYSSLADYFTDVINSGTLVGDWSGIGEDVINPTYPGETLDVSIDPPYRVGVGADAVPDSIDGSIDIPLNPYIETDLGPDVVDPYVDFTPWDTTTVPPDDVIPDVRINPPADVTADPDTPWADDQTYPIEYPTDTTTPLLPDDLNPNTPPSGDDSNKMKLLPLVLSKFPFCLPWDLQHGFKSLVVSGSPPVFDIPLRSVSAGINENIHIDLSRFQSVATVSRWFFSALWIVLLILITRKIVWK